MSAPSAAEMDANYADYLAGRIEKVERENAGLRVVVAELAVSLRELRSTTARWLAESEEKSEVRIDALRNSGSAVTR